MRTPPTPAPEPVATSVQTAPAAQPTPIAVPEQRFVGTGPVAVLLPLSGAYAAPAAAVREGFLAQHFASGDGRELRIYDVDGDAARLLSAYQRALDDGAAFIVGPLMKESVARLAMMHPPVPVLGLNHLDAGVVVPKDFFQIGLSPEDEARAAADDAAARDLRNAVALVPEGDWGNRVLEAFERRVEQWGGRVVASARYRQGVSDQSERIAGLMGIAASRARHRALTNALGVRTEFEPRRRADIDYIFLGARATDARVLLPQFRFHRASGLPHYATSLVYDGRGDAELAGLRFCDMPFMLDVRGEFAVERRQASSASSVAAYPRLYALGRDAYVVAAALQDGSLRVGDSVDGASGTLEWADRSTISRRLRCAELRADGIGVDGGP
ncbi:penicillin-binding protein activator [Sinimarinibacterium sp. HSW-8]|uniref:Penicillin-binding protein activator n=2 Tax=Sinimarinibacterium thermocellulolyticum TaxID=3170016 RepID=A0ABV2A716_9GAMM